MLEGHDLTLITALVRNRSEQRLEIEERACRARQGSETLAVAAWPQVWLEPGAAAELYLAVRPTPVERLSPARPSLLEAGRR
ncbi:MAG: type-F conjugative transfer system secretin TraK [Desulfomicrobium escambiense]|nr:type-F conjugative transfer system secretin TraK [Desulfomicrobium escambiense]